MALMKRTTIDGMDLIIALSTTETLAVNRVIMSPTYADVAARFGVNRSWIHKWVYPVLAEEKDADLDD